MLQAEDLLGLLEGLEPPNADVWHVASIPESRHAFVGKGTLGSVTLLFELEPLTISSRPVALRHIKFSPCVGATINTRGLERRSSFCTLSCIDGDGVLIAYFLRVICNVVLSDAVLQGLTSPIAAIESVLELFASMTTPPRSSVQGLWGELYVIANSTNAGAAITAWHTDPAELFDFVADDQRVEVKTSTTGLRQHVFKLAQLLPAAGTQVFIASLTLSEGADGSSILDLVDSIRRRPDVTDDQRRRLEVVVVGTLGSTWRESAVKVFAPLDSANAVAIYDGAAVPRVAAALPPEVSDVTFRSDLSAIARLGSGDAATYGGLVLNLQGGPSGR